MSNKEITEALTVISDAAGGSDLRAIMARHNLCSIRIFLSRHKAHPSIQSRTALADTIRDALEEVASTPR